MSTLFTFLHHLSAFTLVSALAIEFTLIRQQLTLVSARGLQVTDLALGIAAGALLVIGLLQVSFFEKGADYYFLAFYCCQFGVNRSDHGIPVVAQGVERRPVAYDQREKIETGYRDRSRRTLRHRHHPALCRDHGAGRMGLG